MLVICRSLRCDTVRTDKPYLVRTLYIEDPRSKIDIYFPRFAPERLQHFVRTTFKETIPDNKNEKP